MTADVAALGLSIDSSPVNAAKRALDEFTASATPAAKAAANLSTASTASGKAMSDVRGTATAAVNALNAHTKATNDNAKAHAGMSTQAMSAFHSVRAMTEGFAMGMPVTQVLTQQMNHLSYAASGPGGLTGAFKEALGAFRGLISPAALVGAGVAAAGAAAYLAYGYWKTFTLQLDDTSRAAGTSTAELSKLQAAASFKGITGADFTKAIDSFARSAYEARNNMGGLAEVMRANGVPLAKNFDDAMAKAADLIKNATSDQQRLVLLQQMGLPATEQWSRLLAQGADGLKHAKDEAAQFAANEKLVEQARAFDEALNKAWTNFGLRSRSAIQEAMSGFSSLGDVWIRAMMKIPVLGQNVPTNMLRQAMQFNDSPNRLTNNSDVSKFYSGLGSGAPGNAPSKKTTTYSEAQHELQMETPKLGPLGQMKTAAELQREKAVRDLRQENQNDSDCDRRAA